MAYTYAQLVDAVSGLRSKNAEAAVAVVVGHFDGLQELNQRHGYAAVDRGILDFHNRLSKIAREHDFALNLSGSFFAFVIYEPLHEGHVLLAAEKIGRLADERIEIDDQLLRLDVSMGCAIAETTDATSEQLVRNAEAAMRKSRESDQLALFWSETKAGAPEFTTHPLFDGRQALDNGEFRVFYQPQVNLRTGRLAGAEALIRWQGPDGIVTPFFLEEMERARLLLPMLHFVLNTAAREMARWTRRHPRLEVSVNLSAMDLEDADLVEFTQSMLKMWGLEPGSLKLEITETSLMSDPDKSIVTLKQLRDLGIKTSIDDFGTGYSSLAWLKNLPVDELKIDMSFVSRIEEDLKERQIVSSIIELAHAMDLTVVAEGVENENIARILRTAHCDVGQGYLYAKPLTGKAFEDQWLSSEVTEALAT